jgi:hypothetical protein
MHCRVPRALGKVLAAGATAALLSLSMAGTAGAAGPGRERFSLSGGAPITTGTSCTGFTPLPAQGCGVAGYQASGRDFRYAQAVITIPGHHGVVTATAPGGADPQLYVALDDSSKGSSRFARAGIQPCAGGAPCGSSGWEAFAQVKGAIQPATPPFFFPITAADKGDGVFVSVYLDPADRSVHTVITLPDGSTFNDTFAARGAVYPRAQAVADWTTAAAKPRPQTPSPAKVRDTQFLEGRFTTGNGQQGTFAGPWSLNAFEGTANGARPPAGALVVQPSYLWNDGTNYHGLFGDAFGVWRFPS